MKKICITLIFIFNFIMLIGINAQEEMNIPEPILKAIKNLGISIQDTKFAELEPNELSSYDDYSKANYISQDEVDTYWNTIWHSNLDKLDIITRGSSTLKGYPTTNLFDNKIETAWVPGIKGIKGSGIGEWVSISLYPRKPNCPSGLEYFSMVPGYAKSDQTWEENNRVKSALLVIDNHLGNPEMNAILRLNFEDNKKIQTFNIGDYASIPTFTKKVWLIIENVYKGTKYDDTCISEIVINGIYSPSALDGP